MLDDNTMFDDTQVMRKFKADLHLHTCLSPCGELEMVPTAIVQRVKALGLAMIAVCDHNSVENVLAVARAGEKESLCVIPGIEITSREEVHILGLFRREEELAAIQTLINDNLSGENDADTFGPQVIVNEWDEPIGFNTKLLIGATTLTLEGVVDGIHRLGGLAIASHIDREGFGLLGQLGFIPEELKLDALEVSCRVSHREWDAKCGSFAVITSSDAHRLADIGRSPTTFLLDEPGFEELKKALARENGRKILVQ
jgi:predicted metal-dependent phosphoesterase TrpH